LPVARAPHKAAVLSYRFVRAWPEQRLELWRAALSRIAAAPWIGTGPLPSTYPLPEHAQATTHAHNELLQFTVDYGLVGLLLAAAATTAIVVTARSHPQPVSRDRWLFTAAMVLWAGGLVDFSLRVTAVALLAAVTTTLASTANGSQAQRSWSPTAPVPTPAEADWPNR
jgi:O-Antigen ligase